MCQAIEKVFVSKLAGMPEEVIYAKVKMLCLSSPMCLYVIVFICYLYVTYMSPLSEF